MSKYITSFLNYLSYSSGYNNLDKPNVSLCVEEKKVYYNPVPEKDKYLRFYALEDGTFLFTNNINYSLDGGETWQELTANTDSPVIKTGDYIWWKATLTPNSTNGVGTFSSSGKYNAMGNPLSIRNGDNFRTSTARGYYLFQKMFYESTGLIDVSQLCLTDLTATVNAYYQMFAKCTNLSKAMPVLPATTLNSTCYNGMFSQCTSLIKAPEILATTVVNGSRSHCYAMFSGCTSLQYPPSELSIAVQGLYYTYGYMFSYCTSLKVAPDMSKLESVCEYGCRFMFEHCTSLEEAPELPASVVKNYGYQGMFSYCTSLIKAPSKLPATTAIGNCYTAMFSYCTSLTEVPDLLSTEALNYDSYARHTKINHLTCLKLGENLSSSTFLHETPSGGVFYKHPNSTWIRGVNGIPNNWTIEDAIIETD